MRGMFSWSASSISPGSNRRLASRNGASPIPMILRWKRRYLRISERGGRVLRVACVENDWEIRIVTAFLDRNARRNR
jgi:hypothetical protein